MSNKRLLKAYVRYDGNGRVIAGSLILSRIKPKVGNWVEIQGYLCCNPPSPNDCISYTVTCISTGVISYTDCYGEVIAPVNMNAEDEIVICAQEGTVEVLSGEITVVAGRACTTTTTTTTTIPEPPR